MHIVDINKLSENVNKQQLVHSLFKDGCLEVEFLYKSDYGNTKVLRDFIEAI
ncbi:MAG: hypothetical protein LBF15_00195 [Candidatus Peribacteria bacterium]|jgi:hypothetical protein|nr:hypothetical protein [Candidatus Peribacteria bacterium]